MNDIYQDLASLTPERRALFEVLLKKEGVDLAQLPILKRSTTEPPPLSSIQERFLFLQHLMSNSPAYNVERVIQIRGPLDIAALERTFNEIFRRHEILRTTCALKNGRLVQKIVPVEELQLTIVDLQAIPEPKRQDKALQLAQEEARRSFDLYAGPMLRVALVKLAEHNHLLILVTHHFVADGYSEALLAKELTALYRAFSQGQPFALGELPIQYADYAVWEHQRLQGTIAEDQLAYWKQRLSGAPALLELPMDHPRPGIPTFRGATIHFTLDGKLSEELRALSSRMEVTLFMTLLVAYQLLLHRYSGQDDIVVATAVSNRNRSELEDLIGSFANTVVIRSVFSKDLTFRELVMAVAKTALEGFSHQDIPFDQLVKELHPKRDPSYNPIFQVTFELHQSTFVDSLDFPGLILSYLPVEKGTARFDLDLSMVNDKQGLIGALEYNSDLFEAETIERLLSHFQRLLKGIVADPDVRISELPLLTEPERRQLLVEWNSTRLAYPRDALIHGLFEVQVERTPEAEAVECEGERLSYGELERCANCLAHYLRGCGVGPGVLVGLCVERSVEMVVGLLGILKAGGAYVPLDPDYPKERIAFMLADAQIPVLVTQEGLLGRLPEYGGRVVCLDREGEAIEVCSSERPVIQTGPEDLAYVIYTSGSTGRPKGVEVPHRGVVNFLTSMARGPELGMEDTLLAVTTLSFDIAVLELLLPLSVGARVVIASREVAGDGVELLKLLTGCGATVMQATPATWRLLIETGWRGGEGFKVLCGGEALTQQLAAELMARAGRVWNLYGPTEATVWSTCYELQDPEGPVLIGRPIGNTQVYVLDRYLQPVPVGVPGELYLGGVGVARGYLGQPGLTQERFVPDPFGGEPGARLYRTGDQVRYRADGNLEYLGRLDQQVKIRGFRIELGEVEAVLLEHPRVAQAVVVVREERVGDRRLVAYFVPGPGQQVTVTELRKYLRHRLPQYMVPQHFVELEGLPLTPNGKVDRRALPVPFSGGAVEDSYVAPRTEMEACVVAIWREVLGVERVGVHDNFFDLGGHSLLTLKVAARIEQATGVRLNLRLFVSSTLEQIASLCQKETSEWVGGFIGYYSV
jgi:amino acid adenylation domain-containing protein